MKREYVSPEAEIEYFIISADSLITTSDPTGLGDSDIEEEVEF